VKARGLEESVLFLCHCCFAETFVYTSVARTRFLKREGWGREQEDGQETPGTLCHDDLRGTVVKRIPVTPEHGIRD
jgi:hypothetical protein